MKLVVWLKDASLFNLEQLERKIRQMENVDDVVSIVGNEPMRLTKRGADVCQGCGAKNSFEFDEEKQGCYCVRCGIRR